MTYEITQDIDLNTSYYKYSTTRHEPFGPKQHFQISGECVTFKDLGCTDGAQLVGEALINKGVTFSFGEYDTQWRDRRFWLEGTNITTALAFINIVMETTTAEQNDIADILELVQTELEGKPGMKKCTMTYEITQDIDLNTSYYEYSTTRRKPFGSKQHFQISGECVTFNHIWHRAGSQLVREALINEGCRFSFGEYGTQSQEQLFWLEDTNITTVLEFIRIVMKTTAAKQNDIADILKSVQRELENNPNCYYLDDDCHRIYPAAGIALIQANPGIFRKYIQPEIKEGYKSTELQRLDVQKISCTLL
jgi:hypothetical protein